MFESALYRPSLVLNKNWQPINAVSVRRAFEYAVADKAKIVCPDTYNLYNMSDWMDLDIPDGDSWIQSVKQRIRVPEVLVNHYDKIPQKIVHFSRRNLWCSKHVVQNNKNI